MKKLIIFFIYSSLCFAQHFEGTNLSSTRPFYAKNPYTYEGSENYSITFSTDPEVINKLVPAPLKSISNGEMTLVFAKHKLIHPFKLNYYEAYLYTLVSYGTTVGIYMPVLYLDKVEAIIPGREVAGYNKVGADFDVIENENQISFSISQMDTLIIKATINLGEKFIAKEPSPTVPIINLKYIPSIQENAPPDVKQLTVSLAENSETIERREGTAELEFYSSNFNPLDKIPVLKIDKAGYSLVSFTLTYGEILHNYLEVNKLNEE